MQRNATQPKMLWHVCYTKTQCRCREADWAKRIQSETRRIYTTRGRFPLRFGVAPAFTTDPAPWIEPPSFAPTGEAVIFALAAETALTADTAFGDEPTLAGNPTVLFALFGEQPLALAHTKYMIILGEGFEYMEYRTLLLGVSKILSYFFISFIINIVRIDFLDYRSISVNNNPFRTAVPFRGYTTWNLTGLSPQQGCGRQRVNTRGRRGRGCTYNLLKLLPRFRGSDIPPHPKT